MGKKLSKRIAIKVQNTDSGIKNPSKMVVLALRNEIEEALKDGWTLKLIWQTLQDEGKISVRYPAFSVQVNRLIKGGSAEKKEPTSTPPEKSEQ
ncbi:MAG: TraK family protein [Syntrophobacteraceae bacterium]